MESQKVTKQATMTQTCEHKGCHIASQSFQIRLGGTIGGGSSVHFPSATPNPLPSKQVTPSYPMLLQPSNLLHSA